MPLQSRFMGRAYDVLRTELGRTACAEGWGVTLFEFVAQHGRKPTEGYELLACRDRAAAIAAAKADWPAFCRDAHTRRAARFERIAHGLE
jgi:ATP phosphoribosyltransferase regulatory subunit HisZ